MGLYQLIQSIHGLFMAAFLVYLTRLSGDSHLIRSVDMSGLSTTTTIRIIRYNYMCVTR